LLQNRPLQAYSYRLIRGQDLVFATGSTASNPLLTIIASRLNGFVIIEMRNLEILSSSAIKIFSSLFGFRSF
jgi:hypothetical protein